MKIPSSFLASTQANWAQKFYNILNNWSSFTPFLAFFHLLLFTTRKLWSMILRRILIIGVNLKILLRLSITLKKVLANKTEVNVENCKTFSYLPLFCFHSKPCHSFLQSWIFISTFDGCKRIFNSLTSHVAFLFV